MMMHIKVMEKDKIVFLIAVSLWIIQFIFFKDQLKKEEHGSKNSSLLLVQIGFLLCVIFSFLLSRYFHLVGGSLLRVLSIILLALGIFIRYWTYYLMKAYFTRDVRPHKDRPLLSKGPYRFARHPFHVGLFLITLGFCLFICGHVIAFLIVFVIMGSILHYRMSLEEQQLLQKYGEIYLGWCRRRFRLFPFLY